TNCVTNATGSSLNPTSRGTGRVGAAWASVSNTRPSRWTRIAATSDQANFTTKASFTRAVAAHHSGLDVTSVGASRSLASARAGTAAVTASRTELSAAS